MDNRYLKQRDERRGRRDGHYSKYNEYLERMGIKPRHQEHGQYPYQEDYRNGMDHNSDYRGRDSRGNNDYRQDYRRMDSYSSDYKGSSEEFKEDIHRWTEKLKRKDTFGIKKEEVIKNAKTMGVRFEDFDEDEFYVVYLMHVSDYKSVGSDYRLYIHMAKDWLMDDDIEVSPSEKLCIYFYEIVKGESVR